MALPLQLCCLYQIFLLDCFCSTKCSFPGKVSPSSDTPSHCESPMQLHSSTQVPLGPPCRDFYAMCLASAALWNYGRISHDSLTLVFFMTLKLELYGRHIQVQLPAYCRLCPLWTTFAVVLVCCCFSRNSKFLMTFLFINWKLNWVSSCPEDILYSLYYTQSYPLIISLITLSISISFCLFTLLHCRPTKLATNEDKTGSILDCLKISSAKFNLRQVHRTVVETSISSPC